jgi:branched-chain amino acid aminotransferase
MSLLFPNGAGIFETMKTVSGFPFALSRHIARATRSSQVLGIPFPSEGEIRAAISKEVAQSVITTRIGRLRFSFSTAGELDIIHENYQRWTFPARLMLLDASINETGKFAGIKALPYAENIAYLEFAQSAGADDGIRLNKKGDVCESAVANLLIRIRGTWFTPNLASGCLPGITRGLIIEWFGVREIVIKVEELANAEAIFLLSSLKDAQPVSSLDGRPLAVDSKFMSQIANRIAQEIDP